MTTTACKICAQPSERSFEAKVLGKYEVSYFQCCSCGFIQTEDPYWLTEAYQSAITSLDIGLVSRNMHYLPITQRIIEAIFEGEKTFLDYGGGYGMFVRMMRDAGYNYYRQDDYCENIFADKFDIQDQHELSSFELVTAFEVFEHLPDPVKEMERILQFSSNILFSTELQPSGRKLNADNWWYVAPETGQHVALYSSASLAALAARFDLNYCSYQNLHLFTKKEVHAKTLKHILRKRKYAWLRPEKPLPKRESLLATDFDYIRGLQS